MGLFPCCSAVVQEDARRDRRRQLVAFLYGVDVLFRQLVEHAKEDVESDVVKRCYAVFNDGLVRLEQVAAGGQGRIHPEQGAEGLPLCWFWVVAVLLGTSLDLAGAVAGLVDQATAGVMEAPSSLCFQRTMLETAVGLQARMQELIIEVQRDLLAWTGNHALARPRSERATKADGESRGLLCRELCEVVSCFQMYSRLFILVSLPRGVGQCNA